MVRSVYAPNELINAIIVDSEGYIYGYVEKVIVEPKILTIHAYVEKSSITEQPDIERLMQELIATIKKRFRPPTHEDLLKEIAKETGQHKITDDIIISFAKKKGIPIPIKHLTKTEKELKGQIPWSLVDKVNKTDQGVCIILNKPIEAKERKIPVQDTVPFRELHEIKDKTVIDAEAKIIGQVSGMKIRQDGEPQLTLMKRISEQKEQIDYAQLEENIMSARNWTKYQLYSNVKRELRVSVSPSPDDLVRWAMSRQFSIPKRIASVSREIYFNFLVPWSCIKKIGDVVLLNKRIEELV